jgi:hypothetical protein
MVFNKLKIGKFETEYKFPSDPKAETYPYCDEQKNILDRINETEQQKRKVAELNPIVMSLDLKRQKGTITKEEEENLKFLQKELNVRQEVMNLKPYYINSKTGEVRYTASKLVGDEALDKAKKTSEIPEGKFKETDKGEISRLKFVETKTGVMVSPELWNYLKSKGDVSIKFNMRFGFGITNELRTYVYPSEIEGVLEIVKVSKTRFLDVAKNELQDLEERKELKKMLAEANLKASQMNEGKIAGSLDD